MVFDGGEYALGDIWGCLLTAWSETGPVVEVDYAYVSVGTYYAVTTIYLYIKYF